MPCDTMREKESGEVVSEGSGGGGEEVESGGGGKGFGGYGRGECGVGVWGLGYLEGGEEGREREGRVE